MSVAYFSVDVLTPHKVMARDISVESLLVPTTRGEINILPEHTHLISKLDTGVLRCLNGAHALRFMVTTGVVKVLQSKVTILAQVAERAEEIDLQRAEKALEQARHKINGDEALNDEQLLKFRRKLMRALVRTELAKKPSV